MAVGLEEPRCHLPREISFREYSPCEQTILAPYLLEAKARGVLQEAFRKGWLEVRSEREGNLFIRATHYVGLIPFCCGIPDCEVGGEHLLFIKPKGDRDDGPEGLVRFLDLAFLYDTKETEGKYTLKPGDKKHLFILAGPYSQILYELCKRDFRRYYHPEEGELAGRIRGRPHVAGHLRNKNRGREHLVPCRWEEFTVDNWDNRILLGAIRAVERAAREVDATRGPAIIRKLFLKVAPWLAEVEEVPIHLSDFHKKRLDRVSAEYRKALTWAKYIFRGIGNPDHGGTAPGLVLNAHKAFEKLAQVTAESAAMEMGLGWSANRFNNLDPLLEGRQDRKPDIILSMNDDKKAIGDAKYKEVIKLAAEGEVQLNNPGSYIARISAPDWNQLYVYLRLSGATRGFFVVPYWSADGNPAQRIVMQRGFTKTPLDDEVESRVMVLALNLLKPIGKVRQEGARLLAKWLRQADPV